MSRVNGVTQRLNAERMMMGPTDVDPALLDRHVGEHTWSVGCDGDPYCTDVDPNYAPPEPLADVNTAPRADALQEAIKLICGDRNNQYGPPTQDFKRAADALTAFGYRRVDHEGEHPILPSDVAIIVMQVKTSRLMHSRGKRDSWVDLAGYAGCGYECAVEEADGE